MSSPTTSEIIVYQNYVLRLSCKNMTYVCALVFLNLILFDNYKPWTLFLSTYPYKIYQIQIFLEAHCYMIVKQTVNYYHLLTRTKVKNMYLLLEDSFHSLSSWRRDLQENWDCLLDGYCWILNSSSFLLSLLLLCSFLSYSLSFLPSFISFLLSFIISIKIYNRFLIENGFYSIQYVLIMV